MRINNLMKLIVVGMVIVAALFISQQAIATPWTEWGDAGALPNSAQITTGISELTSIRGTLLAGNQDVDMFAIWITGAGSFYATTQGSEVEDTQLFLFDSDGMGIAGNDDTGPGSPPYTSTISLSSLAAGLYYLAISEFNNDPLSIGGKIFPEDQYGTVGPTGPGGSNPVVGWTSQSWLEKDSEYEIVVKGAVAPVPEPATMLLFGTGLIGIVGLRLLRRKLFRRELSCKGY